MSNFQDLVSAESNGNIILRTGNLEISKTDAAPAVVFHGSGGDLSLVASHTANLTISLPTNTGMLALTGSAVALAAGTQTAQTATVILSDSNGISFGMSGSSRITASYTVPSTAGLISNINLSAGTTSNNLSAAVFSNSNGVSFGLNGSTVTGSVAAGATATGNFGAIAGGTQTATSGTVVFSDSNGISFGMSGSSRITASYTVPSTAGLISNINLSAGTTSNNLSAFVLSNSNGVSFGLNGSTVTGSVAAGATATGNFGALAGGTQTATSGTVVFSDSNGISFGMSGSSRITASYTVPTQTAQTVGIYASSQTTGQSSSSTYDARSLTIRGAGIVTVGNSGGEILISATAAAGAGTVSSATTASQVNSTNVVGADAGRYALEGHQHAGVAGIGLNTTNLTGGNSGTKFGTWVVEGAGVVTALATTGTAGQHTLRLEAPANLINVVANSALAFAAGPIAYFYDSNGISWGGDNGNVFTATADYVRSISAGTTNATGNKIYFSNSNGVSFGANGATITVSVQPGAAAGIGAIAAGTQTATSGTMVFSDSNNVSFGMSGSTRITASIPNNSIAFQNSNDITFGTSTNGSTTTVTASYNFNLSAGTTSNNLHQLTMANSNNITFGLNSSTVTASYNFNASAGTTSNNLNSLVFSNSNNVSFGLNGSTITASAEGHESYWCNIPLLQNSTSTMCQSNSFYVFPIFVPYYLSCSYIRLMGSIALTSTSIATTGVTNTNGTSSAFSKTVQVNAVIYSQNVGASSKSLIYVASGSAGFTWAASVTQASTSNATQTNISQTISQAITYPGEGLNTANSGTQYNVTTSNSPISSTWGSFTGLKYLDIPFENSLAPGNYWVALNRFSGTVGGKNLDMNFTTYGMSQSNLSFGAIGAGTNISMVNPFMGVGVWTTNVANTSSSMAFTRISNTTSCMIPIIQFIRQA